MADHDSSVALPYAKAVFDLAQAGGRLQAWSAFLQLAAQMALDPGVKELLARPGSDREQLVSVMADIARGALGEALFAGEQPQGLNFLRLLAENQRFAVLPDIAARFEVLKAAAENTLEVTLTSASPIDDAQRQRIEKTLAERFQRNIRLTVEVDPQLLGGARLQVGDRVIDGSVRTGLDKLATALRV